MAKTIFQVLEERITEEIEIAQETMGSGSVNDFSEYKELCGLIRGLRTALREVRDLAKNFMEDDND
jgi:hypothetical protein